MRLGDITSPIYFEKNAAFGTTLKYIIPKLKGIFQKEVSSWSRIGRAAATSGKAAYKYGKPAIEGTFQAARKGWSAASTPYRTFSKMTLKGWNKQRNIARFKNPKFTGKGQLGARMGVSGEFYGGKFIPEMIKKPVTRTQKTGHLVGRIGQFATGPLPLFAGFGAASELSKKRYPISSPYIQ